MGMDVFGKKPTSEAGAYFRRNVWGWRPLWDYCQNMHDEIAGKVESGHYNDGDGLNAEDSIALAKELQKDLKTGRVSQYIKERNDRLANMPDEQCPICNGTGQRPDGLANIEWKKPGCNSCDGKGTIRPWETNYGLEEEDIQEFAEFLESCGGFEIC